MSEVNDEKKKAKARISAAYYKRHQERLQQKNREAYKLRLAKKKRKKAEERKKLILEAIGQASMCWSKIPSGRFEAEKAKQIAEDLVKKLEEMELIK